jgi:hypothetical protein
MKSSKEERYISVEQIIRANNAKQKIKIRLSDLSQIIDTLQTYQKEMSNPESEICKNYLSEEKQKTVAERYLKGISINDLALQFDCTNEIILQVLSHKKIEIDNDLEARKRELIRLSKLKY